MNQILAVRSKLYDQFHGSSAGPAHFFLDSYEDDYAAYYTAMYLIQDTGEAVMQHMVAGFSNDPWQAYLECWGVMQAFIIQQDAIVELHRAVVGSAVAMPPRSAWLELRDIRNICAGHPVRRTHGRSGPQRAFMGRSFGNYDQIRYELKEAGTKNPTHPVFNLRRMINSYDREGSQVLQVALASMNQQWP